MKKLILAIPVVFLFACSGSLQSNSLDSDNPVVANDVGELALINDRFCTTCHGADGNGNKGIEAPRLAGMEDWYLRRQLENFRDGIRGTHEMDEHGLAMQPMATELTDARIDAVVDWIAEWEMVPAAATITGNVNQGRTRFQTCATCHGANAEGNEALGAPALAGQNDWYLVTQLKNFRDGYRGTHPEDQYGQQMSAMARSLGSDQVIMNLVSYINTLN